MKLFTTLCVSCGKIGKELLAVSHAPPPWMFIVQCSIALTLFIFPVVAYFCRYLASKYFLNISSSTANPKCPALNLYIYGQNAVFKTRGNSQERRPGLIFARKGWFEN